MNSSQTPVVSIIICTCNRADDVEATLQSFARLDVPPDLPTELIVVDNGSKDDTMQRLEDATTKSLPNMTLRVLCEPRRGRSNALNTALAAARGQIVLLTDDDVHPEANWLREICAPLLDGRADAVAGRIRIAPHLLRPWMTRRERALLASTEWPEDAQPQDIKNPFLVGANSGFKRAVFSRVPAFDTELGPGKLGFEDDVLITLQLRKAGFRIEAVPGAVVEHHFQPARLLRSSFLSRAEQSGKGRGYLTHHWQHERVSVPHLRLIKHKLKLAWMRLLHRRECRAPEGCPEWEMSLLQDVCFIEQYVIERRRPRNYDYQGLVQRAPHKASA